LFQTKELSQPGGDGGGPRYSLVLYHRDGAIATPLRPRRGVVVGRVPPADVVVDDESLSRQHARFLLLDDGVMVEDMGSTNGTWVGGESIKASLLTPGDVAVLGNVRAVVQSLEQSDAHGLGGHDRFLAQLEAEVVRARHFGRPFALAMVHADDRNVSLHSWVQQVAPSLRAVDTVALYSNHAVEILLPELGAGEGVAAVRRLMEAQQDVKLLCSVTAYPDCGTSSESLVESCRVALKRATTERPVQVAPSTMVAERSTSSDATRAGIASDSKSMKELLKMAQRIARGAIPVFVHGETGTGKEVLARFIHDAGPRGDKPLVAVNCAAIPAQLIESTLFGHERGAFTGANQAHAGVFEAAHEGTVLLDEIAELPAAAQAALLRVLESKVVTRVGSTKETNVDTRIIAASHRDLEQMCEAGEFRFDLYYRLNAVTLEIPALRDRKEDILPLAERFLQEASAANGIPIDDIDEDAREALSAYKWPGNIRELRNAIDRAVVICEHRVVGLRDLPKRVQRAGSEPASVRSSVIPSAAPGQVGGAVLRQPAESFRACMERLESSVLVEALESAKGNQSEAARRLEMPRRTFVHKLKVLGVKKR
jgi:DNA-binding NtrC family response regulator